MEDKEAQRERQKSLSAFDITEVCNLFLQLGATEMELAKLRKEHVDGKLLVKLSQEDLKTELGLSLKVRKNFEEYQNSSCPTDTPAAQPHNNNTDTVASVVIKADTAKIGHDQVVIAYLIRGSRPAIIDVEYRDRWYRGTVDDSAQTIADLPLAFNFDEGQQVITVYNGSHRILAGRVVLKPRVTMSLKSRVK